MRRRSSIHLVNTQDVINGVSRRLYDRGIHPDDIMRVMTIVQDACDELEDLNRIRQAEREVRPLAQWQIDMMRRETRG